MIANGYTNRETAKIIGCSESGVRNVMGTEIFRDRIVEAINNNVGKDLAGAIKEAAEKAFVRIVELAGDENLKKNDAKLYADQNRYLVDRFLGRPTQPVENRTADPETLTDDQIDDRLNTLRSRGTPPS